MFLPVTIKAGRIEYEPLEELVVSLKDMRAPLAYVGDRLRAGVAEQFESEGAWGGQPWADLTENYRNWKAEHGPSLPKLVGLRAVGRKGTRTSPISGKRYTTSGKMRVELLAPSAVTVSEKRMVYAPVSKIAGYHQEGTPKMVARPPVVIPLRELDEWEAAFGEWLDGLVERVNS